MSVQAPSRGELLTPLLAGALLILSFPPIGAVPAAFVGLAPLLVLVAELPAGAGGARRAARAGMVTGAALYGVMLAWIPVALLRHTLLALPIYLLAVAVLAGSTALFGGALHHALHRTAVPLAPAAAILWTAAEWLIAHLGPLSFPWLGLAVPLAAAPRVAGAADLVGASGLGFWVALVNGLVAAAVLDARAGRGWARSAAVAALVAAVPVAYGVARAATLESRPAARVALVQTSIPPEVKLDPTRALDASLEALARLTAEVAPGSVDLVAWPEVAVPARLEPGGQIMADVAALSRRARAPILAGAYGGAEDRRHNSAFLIGPDPAVAPAYHKRRLVPFFERVPFADAAAAARLLRAPAAFGRLSPGAAAPPFELGDARFGVLVCFESAFAAEARRQVAAGADFLVNITNDAWFGAEAHDFGTAALRQHRAHLVLRAIELRRGMARIANGGTSFVVDPTGRTLQPTRPFTADARAVAVTTSDAHTLYARTGDLPADACAAAAVLLVAAGWRRRRHARAA